jgi:hypothetical protein
VLTPGQLATIITIVIGAALWMNNIAQKVQSLSDAVAEIKVSQVQTAARLDVLDHGSTRRK